VQKQQKNTTKTKKHVMQKNKKQTKISSKKKKKAFSFYISGKWAEKHSIISNGTAHCISFIILY